MPASPQPKTGKPVRTLSGGNGSSGWQALYNQLHELYAKTKSTGAVATRLGERGALLEVTVPILWAALPAGVTTRYRYLFRHGLIHVLAFSWPVTPTGFISANVSAVTST